MSSAKLTESLQVNKLQANKLQANQILADDVITDTLIVNNSLTINNNVSDTVKKIVENANLDELQYILEYAINATKSIHTNSFQMVSEEYVSQYEKELLLPSYSAVLSLRSIKIEAIPDTYNEYTITFDIPSLQLAVHNNFTTNNFVNVSKDNLSEYTSNELDLSQLASGLLEVSVIELFTRENTYLINMISQTNNTMRIRLLTNCHDGVVERTLFEHNVNAQLNVAEFENAIIRLIIPKSIYNFGFGSAIVRGIGKGFGAFRISLMHATGGVKKGFKALLGIEDRPKSSLSDAQKLAILFRDQRP